MERELSEIKKENNLQREMIRRHDRRRYSNVTGATICGVTAHVTVDMLGVFPHIDNGMPTRQFCSCYDSASNS